MLGKKIINETVKKNVIHYRFNVNDSVLCTTKNSSIKNAIILTRYSVGGINFYKISDNVNEKVCKETELIHR